MYTGVPDACALLTDVGPLHEKDCRRRHVSTDANRHDGGFAGDMPYESPERKPRAASTSPDSSRTSPKPI